MKTKEEIMQISFELFKEKGYDNVSIDSICQICQINKTIFYKLIESKEYILKYHFQLLYEQIMKITQEHEKNIELLYIILMYPIKQNMKLGPELYAKYIIRHLHGQTLSAHFKEPIKILGIQLIEQAQKDGLIKNQSDSEHLFNVCRNITGSYAILWCTQKGNFDLVEKCETSLKHILSY